MNTFISAPSVARSRNMSAIRGKDTRPELTVRRFIHSRGMRYSVASSKLPGRPDIVLRKYRTVVFVNGCFWHRHQNCRFATLPKTNSQFWKTKFSENVNRDRRNVERLRELGWRVLTIWECQTQEWRLEALVRKIQKQPAKA